MKPETRNYIKMAEVGIIIKTREDGSIEVKKLGDEFKKTGDMAEQSAKKITDAWDEAKEKMFGLSKSLKYLLSSFYPLTQASLSFESLTNHVLAMQQEIENIQASVLVTLDDQASPGIEAIQNGLDELQDKTITITILHKNVYGESNHSYTDYGGELHSGTPFVSRTGMYLLERGEAVIPASQNDHRHYDNRQINNFTFNQPPPNSFEQEQRFRRLMAKRVTI
jgi:hypothetical protein